MADFRLRIGFAKEGLAVWLSHLEVVRAMERSVRRSCLPYSISQGFNSHMKHSFSAALPVGTGSWGEYMDVELERLVEPEQAFLALKAREHPCLPVLSAGYVSRDEPSLQVAFNLATYVITFKDPSGALAFELLRRLKVSKEIEVRKKDKLKRYDLSLYVVEAELTTPKETSVPLPNQGLRLSLLASPEGSLRPEVLLAALAAGDLEAKLATITRVSLAQKPL